MSGYTRTQYRAMVVPANRINRIVLHRERISVPFPTSPVPYRTEAVPEFVPPSLPAGTNVYSARGGMMLDPQAPRQWTRRDATVKYGAMLDPELHAAYVAELIRRRKALGVTQGKLADAIQYARGSLSAIERGLKRMREGLYTRADAYLTALEEARS